VLRALPQRRQRNLHHGEPEVEIGAEAARVHLGAQVAVRRGDDAQVDGDELVRADAPDLAVLERAQELRLEIRREIADLVEKERPARRLLERADAPGVGAGERALLVPEQLALEEVGGDRAAVHDHERLVAASARLVQRLGGLALAGARLALEQDRRVRRGRPFEERDRVTHGRGLARQWSETGQRRDLGAVVLRRVIATYRRATPS